MQPSNELLTKLRALAAIETRREPLSVVEDKSLLVPVSNAYQLGKVDGRV